MEKKLQSKKIISIAIFLVLAVSLVFIFSDPKDNVGKNKIEIKEEHAIDKVPADFPESFPLPDGASVLDSSVKETEAKKGISLIVSSQRSFEDLVVFYKSELRNKGWGYDVVGQGDNFITFDIKKDNYSGFLGIIEEDLGSRISVTIGVD